MKIHHLRNATMIIESKQRYILIDPMLSAKGALPPFSFFKYKRMRNPTVSLPENVSATLEKTTHCLLTHSQKWGLQPLTHSDHFDKAGEIFLVKHAIPVTTLRKDAPFLNKRGIKVETELEHWKSTPFLDGSITAVPAKHGHSWMHHFMANGAGFFIQLPDEPSIYISGDTVYTDDVKRALDELKPDIAVVAAGTATMDVGGPILMPIHEIVTFIAKAPGQVMANHLEALNHCPTTRTQLRDVLSEKGLLSKTRIPSDGEVMDFEKLFQKI